MLMNKRLSVRILMLNFILTFSGRRTMLKCRRVLLTETKENVIKFKYDYNINKYDFYHILLLL